MLKILNDIQPDKEVLDALASYQKQINDLPTFDEKRAKAKELFLARNKKGNRIFDAITDTMKQYGTIRNNKITDNKHLLKQTSYEQFLPFGIG